MKIVLSSMQDVTDFLGMFKPEMLASAPIVQDPWQTSLLPRSQAALAEQTLVRKAASGVPVTDWMLKGQFERPEAEPDEGLPADIDKPVNFGKPDWAGDKRSMPQPVEDTGPSLPVVAAIAPEVDATGRKWNERIDSSNKGLNADGTWRARRNHGLSADEVAAIKAEMTVDEKGSPERDPEPEVTTETHPLPVQEPEPAEPICEGEPGPEPPVQEAAAPLDLDEVLIKGAELAADASDSHMDVLSASREFISSFDLDVYNAVKAATVEGKALQTLTPGERRLLIGTLNAYTQANGTPGAS